MKNDERNRWKKKTKKKGMEGYISLSNLTAEARIEVKSSMVRKSEITVFLRYPQECLSTVIASSHLCFFKTPTDRRHHKVQ